MRKLMTLVTLSLLCSAATAQQIYQWTDAQGRAQFGQLPPANTPYQAVDIRAPAPIGGQLRAPVSVPSETAEAKAERVAEQRRLQQAEEELVRYCERLRQDITTMENNPRLRRTNADGEVERIGEDERQLLIQQAQEKLQEHC